MLPHEKSITLKGIAHDRGAGPSLLRLFVPFIQSIVNLRKLNNPRNRIAVMYFYCQGFRNIFMQTEKQFSDDSVRLLSLWYKLRFDRQKLVYDWTICIKFFTLATKGSVL